MTTSILITGCSSGIGLQVALDLQKLGYLVFASCRSLKDVSNLINLGLLNAIQLDVTDDKSIDLALNHILAKTGGTLDVLFNNAGYGQIGAIEDLSREAMFNQFNTNVFSVLQLTNKVLPIMRQQGHGKIIVTSSVLGFIALRYRGAYVASKFALEGLFDTLRLELMNTPISVSIIQPGPISSNFRKTSHQLFNKYINYDHSQHLISYQKMEEFYSKVNKNIFELTPGAVTKKVLHILSHKPRSRYSVTIPTYLFHVLTRFLPVFILDKILYKITDAETK